MTHLLDTKERMFENEYMIAKNTLVVPLIHCTKDDSSHIGGKAANLGEMINSGFPVPLGFVVTSHAYQIFLQKNKLDLKIKHLLGTLNFNSPDSLSQVSRNIKKLIIGSPIPDEITKAVFDEYKKLGLTTLVAVRSSATSEDSKDASFAGQQETFLNVSGEAHLMEKIRQGWASLFDARAMYYRHEAKMDQLKSGIALAIQEMVQPQESGIMFTVDPVTNNKSRITIEAIYGLGEYIVQGKVTPDHYEVAKDDFLIVDKKIAAQKVMLVRKGDDNVEATVLKDKQDHQKITDADIVELAKLGKKLEDHYFFPQDIEWAKSNGKIYLVQTRPITTLSEVEKTQKATEEFPTAAASSKPILIGDPASPGVGIGRVKIIHEMSEASSFEDGMVLVTRATNPDYVPLMKKAAAIVTAEGGRTSHAAIVSREYGIPAIVGAHLALSHLKNGMVVTVNGKTGEVFAGNMKIDTTTEKSQDIKTATKVYINLAEPELAEQMAAKNVDGIGLLRAEFMIAQIGTHPKEFIERKKENEFIDRLSADIATFCKAFYPRPVLYRATDFKTNEYRNLTGGQKYEPVESNPMLGYRGAYRYMHDPRVFKLEIEAIKKVREKMGLTNLRLMLPFVRTVHELEAVKKIIHEGGLQRSHTFKLFMMVEIPANVILIDDFIDAGIDGISIGSNDLTMLTLGTDRDNEEVAVEFDERNKAVLWSFERVIKAAREHDIEAGICGQAPSEFPDLIEKLVHWGIHSISVSPDAINTTRKAIHKAELKLLERLK